MHHATSCLCDEGCTILLPVSVMGTLGTSGHYTKIVFAILSLSALVYYMYLPGFAICHGIESSSSGRIVPHDLFFHSFIDGHLSCFRGQTLF